ncbi:type II toxin-antitoxin system RelE/ParE family toxin [Micavibrio aeruginosavorus]|uniref:Plasmid maintenance system killer family protein n=1 Tax=Micavibrio aeruginosavorus (strain ARL-13) TaxID=856793 RepID=G2KT78_MICAA|nr:type II toxin-antitoxin system RelE/ParE family toxin [Micavibrio aeruginosavorus]AEP10622.1 plasmid maintenance system killer family protein [Micavibrio aeruginosavorus ARL-13]
MIRSFACKDTAKIWEGLKVRGFPGDMQDRALMKLRLIDAAQTVDDLKIPPGNRLEDLRGDRKGQKSIRINDQWRICFVWKDGDAFDVEITDYH